MAQILIVDDYQPLRDLLKTILEFAGHQVREAEDGKAALQSHRQNPADLILMDLSMPEKEGIETIIELRRSYPKIKIIAMSGTCVENLKMAQFLGADAAFQKPVDDELLINTIYSLLKN